MQGALDKALGHRPGVFAQGGGEHRHVVAMMFGEGRAVWPVAGLVVRFHLHLHGARVASGIETGQRARRPEIAGGQHSAFGEAEDAVAGVVPEAPGCEHGPHEGHCDAGLSDQRPACAGEISLPEGIKLVTDSNALILHSHLVAAAKSTEEFEEELPSEPEVITEKAEETDESKPEKKSN